MIGEERMPMKIPSIFDLLAPADRDKLAALTGKFIPGTTQTQPLQSISQDQKSQQKPEQQRQQQQQQKMEQQKLEQQKEQQRQEQQKLEQQKLEQQKMQAQQKTAAQQAISLIASSDLYCKSLTRKTYLQ